MSKFLEVLLRPIKDCFGNKKESMYNAILKKASRNTIFYDTLHTWAKNGEKLVQKIHATSKKKPFKVSPIILLLCTSSLILKPIVRHGEMRLLRKS